MIGIESMFGDMSRIITLAVALPFVIIAVVFGGLWLRNRQRISASQSWPTAMGRVLASTTQARHSSDSGTSHYPVVLYEYTVNGQRYQSNQINFGSQIGYGMQSWAQKRIDKYPANGTVEVYYNPEDPSQAVLERSSSSGRIFLLVAVLILAILACTIGMTLGGMNLVQQLMGQFGL